MTQIPIAIVEDSLTDAKILQSMLGRLEYNNISIFDQGDTFMNQKTDHKIIFLDVEMSPYDGPTILEHLRKSQANTKQTERLPGK